MRQCVRCFGWMVVLLTASVAPFGALRAATAQGKMEARVQVWDTMSPFADRVNAEHPPAWRAARGDKPYSPQGDLVVETEPLREKVFWSGQGKVVVFSRSQWQQRAEVVPLGSRSTRIASVRVVRNTGREAVVQAVFAGEAESSERVGESACRRVGESAGWRVVCTRAHSPTRPLVHSLTRRARGCPA
jgi:hypothetical protein